MFSYEIFTEQLLSTPYTGCDEESDFQCYVIYNRAEGTDRDTWLGYKTAIHKRSLRRHQRGKLYQTDSPNGLSKGQEI